MCVCAHVCVSTHTHTHTHTHTMICYVVKDDDKFTTVKTSIPIVLIPYCTHSCRKKDAGICVCLCVKKNKEGNLTVKNVLKIIFNFDSS